MSATKIGTVKGGKTGRSYDVKWNSKDRTVYVSYAGSSNAGKASSASEAMRVGEAYVYDK